MMLNLLSDLKTVPDAELLDKVKSLASHERSATALLVAHLAELDTRDVLLREGYASLFAYCREALGLSEHGSLNRIEVARAARRFPAILDMLADGRVNLTTVRLLAPHLDAGNFERVLAEARGRRTEEIRAMAGGLSALSERSVPARPGSAPVAALDPATRVGKGAPAAERDACGEVKKEGASAPPATPEPAAATPQRRPVTLTGPTLDKLRLAKDMLRHALPAGDENEIVDRALTVLLADLARKKFADTDRPRGPRGTKDGSRDVPAGVMRAVWLRDLGCCAYVGPNGHRCEERGFLEFHHVRPFEVGGEGTVENIQLRCGRHNRYEAKVYFRRGDSSGEEIIREGGAPYGSVTQGIVGQEMAAQGMAAPGVAANSF